MRVVRVEEDGTRSEVQRAVAADLDVARDRARSLQRAAGINPRDVARRTHRHCRRGAGDQRSDQNNKDVSHAADIPRARQRLSTGTA